MPPAIEPTRMISRWWSVRPPSTASPSRMVQSPTLALASALTGSTHGAGSGRGRASATVAISEMPRTTRAGRIETPSMPGPATRGGVSRR